MLPIPHEFAIGGVYMPPLLVAGFLGGILTIFTTKWMNHYRISRFFFYPPLVYVSILVIYTVIISTFVIGG